MPDELNDWAEWVTIVSLPLAILSILVSIGFFVRRNRTLKELIYIEQERDNIQKTAAAIEKRLKLVIANLEHRLEIVAPGVLEDDLPRLGKVLPSALTRLV